VKDPVRIFQFVLLALCIGLLGVIPIIISLPKSAELYQKSLASPKRPQIRNVAWDTRNKFATDYNVGKYRDAIADAAALEKSNALDQPSAILTAQAYYKEGDYAGCVKYIQDHFDVPKTDNVAKLGRPVIAQLLDHCQK